MAGIVLWVTVIMPGSAGVDGQSQPQNAKASVRPDGQSTGRDRSGAQRDGLRRRISEWLIENEGHRRQAEDVLRRLDEGADPAQVREELDRIGIVRQGSGTRGGRAGRPEESPRVSPGGEEGPGPRPLPGDVRFKLSPEER